MPCFYCKANFSLIKWKKKCDFCTHHFCTTCIVQKRCLACANVLNCQWKYDKLMHVKIKDLKLYLTVRGTPVHLYTEKNELVRLVILKNQARNNIGTHIDHSPGETESHDFEPARSNLSMPDQSADNGVSRNTNSHEEISSVSAARTVSSTGTVSMGTDEASRTQRDQASIGPEISPGLENTDCSASPMATAGGRNSIVERPIPSGLANKIIIADIKSKDQIELLTARELKQILYDNFINYKGCVEKIELQAKVHSLYHDKKKSEQSTGEGISDETNMCKICWDETIDCVLLDCGHMATCTSCGKRLNECPICRQFIVRCVHVFRS